MKRLLTAASVAALLASPALAQTTTTPGSAPSANPTVNRGVAMPAQGMAATTFLSQQSGSEWLNSNLVGASVKGPDNKSIGEIEDIVIDSTGTVKAAVVGVGGFLGIGEKSVAVPFAALNVTRNANNHKVESVSVSFTKQQLEQAPAFKTLADADNTNRKATTGAGTTTAPANNMNKNR